VEKETLERERGAFVEWRSGFIERRLVACG
jgi:hypothetical protein